MNKLKDATVNYHHQRLITHIETNNSGYIKYMKLLVCGWSNL